eukprot:GHVH01012814.1.p1 GENE.GHVH01012814.1~~GHVH01012814.1.p1  ORF type:complete len:111 (-),score=8.21 GHVH01012814.1:93-425(-)
MAALAKHLVSTGITPPGAKPEAPGMVFVDRKERSSRIVSVRRAPNNSRRAGGKKVPPSREVIHPGNETEASEEWTQSDTSDSSSISAGSQGSSYSETAGDVGKVVHPANP